MTHAQDGADFALPDDLAALERALTDRAGPDAGPDVRERVLAAVRRALPPQAQRPGRRWPWGWLAAGAAAVLVAMNFSTSVINNIDWRLAQSGSATELDAVARQLQAVAPGLSVQDARRHALLLDAGMNTTPAPFGRTKLDQFLQPRERATWDTH